MSVGALEPQFYNELISKLEFSQEQLPQLGNFEESRIMLQNKFKQKTQKEWCEVSASSLFIVKRLISSI